LHDPEAVRACGEAGGGGHVALAVGARAGDMRGRAVAGGGRGARPHGGVRFFDAGPTAVLDSEAGPTIVLQTNLIQNISLEEYRSVGIDPRRFRAIIAKGVNAPRFAYVPIASELIQVDTAGVTSADLGRFRYHRRPQPLFPFEKSTTFTAGAEI